MKRIVASLPALTTAVAILLAMSPSYGQNTVILGCVNKSSGEIKIVSTAGQCKSNEALISWNQSGIQGPAGPAGPQGPQGTAGVPLGVCSDSATKTYILFPFLTNQAGFDTGLSIANTTSDPFGTTKTPGTCTLDFFGGTTAAPTTPPAPVTTPTIAAGANYTTTLQTIAPNFQGYMIASCNFPLAHGFAFISDLGARNLAMGYLPFNICSPRIPPQ